MKKAIILILGGAASLTLSLVLGINAQSRAESVNELFETNLEALADVEHKGTCKHEHGDCIAVCPVCHKLVWADETGPSNNDVYEEITAPDDSTTHPANPSSLLKCRHQ